MLVEAGQRWTYTSHLIKCHVTENLVRVLNTITCRAIPWTHC